jgi:hypothetical protein
MEQESIKDDCPDEPIGGTFSLLSLMDLPAEIINNFIG